MQRDKPIKLRLEKFYDEKEMITRIINFSVEIIRKEKKGKIMEAKLGSCTLNAVKVDNQLTKILLYLKDA